MALAILLGASGNGCTPLSSPPVSAPIPVPDLTASHQRFTPGIYQYRFSQTTQIRQIQGDSPADSPPGIITTEALIDARVSIQPDSTFTVTVSFDSIRINTQGPIPGHQLGQPVRLDSVLHATFSRVGTASRSYLADSLCMYSQFTAIAREVLLPELGLETEIPIRKNSLDTATYRSCRAGTSIEMTTIRELRESRQNTREIEVQQHTDIHGSGVLQRDSVLVNGSISTRGKILFAAAHRLPTSIQTQSEGTIRVQLGSTVTVFHQQSNQMTHLLAGTP